MGGWFRKEIKEVGDFNGLKMRIGGWAGKTLSKLGVVPQQIAGGDIYPALEKGTIDAAEWVGPYDDEKLGFYKVAKFYYYPGWWEGGTTNHLMVNLAEVERAAEELPGDPDRGGGCGQCRRNGALRRAQSGGPEAAGRGRRATAPVPAGRDGGLPEGVDRGEHRDLGANADYKKVWDSIVAFRNDEYLWWQVAEYTYDTFMIRTRPRA